MILKFSRGPVIFQDFPGNTLSIADGGGGIYKNLFKTNLVLVPSIWNFIRIDAQYIEMHGLPWNVVFKHSS